MEYFSQSLKCSGRLRAGLSLLFVLITSVTFAQVQKSAPSTLPPLPASTAFTEWLGQQRNRGTGAFADARELAAGLQLARSRASELRALLETDPEAFIRQAMPESERSTLPGTLQSLIERRISRRGAFGVYCGGLPETASLGSARGHSHPGYGYEVRLDGVTYRASVFGKWRNQKSVREAEITGVILGDAIAIGDSPTPGEQVAAGSPVTADAPSTTGPNTLLYMIARFSDQTDDPVSVATAVSHMTVVSNFWMNNSSGTVSLHGLVSNTMVMDIVQIVLPHPAWYATNYNASFDSLLSDARNAAVAKGLNYANYNLDLVVTTGSGFGYAGRAYIGGQGAHCVAGYTSLRTSGHELGHNLGLYHADYWRTDATRPFGRDSVPGGYVADTSNAEWIEYGHYFSLMAAQSGGEIDDPTKPHYAAVEKYDLGWLSGAEVQFVSSSGSYRLYRHDSRIATGTPRAIRIETPATDYTGNGRRYWLNYRYAPWSVGQDWLRNGIQIDVCQSSYGSDGAIQLDMTPYSYDASSGASYTSDNTDKRDGALVVGHTYSDVNAGIHITPTATGNFGPEEEYIDLVVNLGSFPGNRPPVISSFTVTTNQIAANQSVNFTVAASDPDGDSLAYAWDFDQVQTWTQSGLNSASATKSWPNAGQYRVTVTVSDLKGGIASESAIITVGTPADNRQIWGRVLWGGTPVYGARVWSIAGTTTYQAWTASDGTYGLTGLSSTNSYLLKCQRDGLTFASQFANPVSVVGADAFGNDFYANETLPGGGGGTSFAISGQVTSAGTGVSGAEVRAGGKVVISDSGGNYQFTNFPPGSYTVMPRKDAWTFSPASRVVSLTSADSSGNNFSRSAPYTISGRVDGPATGGNSPAPTVYLSNGQSVQATKQGTGGSRYWGYTLSGIPAGQFSVSAELSGYLIQPNGFSNPLTVGGNLSTINFNGSSSTTSYSSISGRLTERGLPLSGAPVAARVGSVTVVTTSTDSDGYYRLANLTNGAYSVVASLTGYSFTPATINVGNVPASGQNFTATSAATPPVISSILATPTVVSNMSLPATLTVTASGFAPLSFGWDALTAPAPVAFSVNDSASAAATVVSFQSPGSYTFRARVVDGHGFVTTANVNLTVSSGAGALVVSPYEVQVAAGQSVAFQADAWDQLGNPISVSSQWSVSGGGNISAGGLFNATTPGGPYQVSATSGTLTATGTIWVMALAQSPPSILAQPQSQLVGLGSNVTFSVQANGTAPLSYQWLMNGTNLDNATSSSFTRTNVQLVDAGNYSVLVTNALGLMLSSNALLTVVVPPQISTHPLSQTLALGSNVTFTVSATGGAPLGFQWRKDGTNILGAISNSFTRTGLVTADNGLYSVQVSNLAGTVISSNALLTVVAPPLIATQPVSLAVAAGSNFIFSVVVTGTAPFAYQWRLNGTNLPGATTNVFSKLSAQPADAGTYTAVVSNLAGVAFSDAAILAVNRFPSLNPISDQTIHAGSALLLTNSASDLDLPAQFLTYSLLAGAPAGATINSTNGIFAWNSTVGDSGTTNAVTIKVADNGTPSLSDSKSFAIRVIAPLKIQSIVVSNNSMTVSWSAIPGRTYQVQAKDDLDGNPWAALPPDVVAVGATAFFTEPVTASHRLYRVVLLP